MCKKKEPSKETSTQKIWSYYKRISLTFWHLIIPDCWYALKTNQSIRLIFQTEFNCFEFGVFSLLALSSQKNTVCHIVIYWPSTELSVKRYTCVNKPKKSGSRWTLENNISRCPGRLSSVGDKMPKWEPASFAALSDPRLSNPSQRCERSAVMVKRRTWVNIAVCPSLHSFLTHNRSSTLSKIKCEKFIFCKEVYSFVIEVVHYRLIMFSHIFA